MNQRVYNFLVVLQLSVLSVVSSFTLHAQPCQNLNDRTKTTTTLQLSMSSSSSSTTATSSSRRDVIKNTFGLFTGMLTTSVWSTPAAFAATAAAPTREELDRIKQGYLDLTDLLNNWDEYTTTCRENGGECKRNADAVRKALGLRSTTDPLFQIEKVFAKVRNIPDLDLDQLETFYDATEEWNSAVNLSNSMAFISQFGEYNPGGGQDQVLKYLNESKQQVIIAQKALKTILDCLQL